MNSLDLHGLCEEKLLCSEMNLSDLMLRFTRKRAVKETTHRVEVSTPASPNVNQ